MVKKHPLATVSGVLAVILAGFLLANRLPQAANQDAVVRNHLKPVTAQSSENGEPVQPSGAAQAAAGRGIGEPKADKSAPSTPPTAAEKAALADGNNAFALELYAKLKDAEKGNLFFSPYSVSTALAMTYSGARGNTAAQMEKALHFTLGRERLHHVCGALVQELNAAEKNGRKRGFQLSVANRLFGQKGYAFLPPFMELTRTSYGAGLEELDFKAQVESSRLTINKWVEGRTQEKIKDLIQPGGITSDTRLVLTNAIYFKGDWDSPFKKKWTQEAPFQLAAAGNINVPMMNKEAEFKYMEDENGLQTLELPYKDNELSMVVFLPAKADGLLQLEKSFSAGNLKNWISKLSETDVNVSLPKFKLTWGAVDVADTLKTLGMMDAFNFRSADFSGMTNDPQGLFISKVFHKAFVEVNEEGTEAAAATAVVGPPKGCDKPRQPKRFRADHPFLFLIRENATGNILFMGRVVDPR